MRPMWLTHVCLVSSPNPSPSPLHPPPPVCRLPFFDVPILVPVAPTLSPPVSPFSFSRRLRRCRSREHCSRRLGAGRSPRGVVLRVSRVHQSLCPRPRRLRRPAHSDVRSLALRHVRAGCSARRLRGVPVVSPADARGPGPQDQLRARGPAGLHRCCSACSQGDVCRVRGEGSKSLLCDVQS